MTAEHDVIVAGLGPVGAAAAHFLGARGIRTLVLEKGIEPYTLPRAIHFDHEIMRLFQSAGLAPLVEPHVYSPAGAMFFGAHRRPLGRFRPNVRTDRLGWPSANYFYQPELEALLRDALAERPSVKVRTGCEVVGVTQDEAGVTVRFRHQGGEESASAAYLLGCDGGRSIVRRMVDVGLDDLNFDEPWIVVDAFVDGPLSLPELRDTPDGVDMQQVLFIIGDPARPTSVIPGIGRHRRWEFMLMPGETPEDYADGTKAAALIAPFVADAEFELIRCAVYRFHALIAHRWQQGRVFLAGDSAHQTPPFFGQGLCHGIRDAANLAWKLEMVLRGDASPALLDTYQREREPQVRAVVAAAVGAGRSLCTLDAEQAALRDAAATDAAAVAAPAPAYVDLIPPLTGGLLAGTHRSGVGTRFIQPPVEPPAGGRRLLDDATQGGWVLLAQPDAMPSAAASMGLGAGTELKLFPVSPQAIADVTGELQRWFEHHGCAGVIVRPDFYVYGTFDSPEQGQALIEELRQSLQTPAVANA